MGIPSNGQQYRRFMHGYKLGVAGAATDNVQERAPDFMHGYARGRSDKLTASKYAAEFYDHDPKLDCLRGNTF